MNLFLIGGRTTTSGSDNIERFIINYKENPNILLVPAASKDSMRSDKNLSMLFNKYKCQYKFLYLYRNPLNIYESLEWADIIYFSGGDTRNLTKALLKYNIVEYLKNTDKLLVGISAGMNVMGYAGMGDSDAYQDNYHTYNYKMQDGVGLIDFVMCPHYDNYDLDIFNDVPKEYQKNGLALENDTAIYISDDGYKVIKDNNKNSVYMFLKEDNYKMDSLYNNKTISCLGPEGTFCDVCCKNYLKKSNKDLNIKYYPSIRKTIESLDTTGIAVVPFENSLDGFVLETLDTLIKNNYYITTELEEKVDFAFVSFSKDIKNIKNVYVQFKAKAECIEFLQIKNNFNLITTDSNMLSLENLLKSDETYGAVIPIHKVLDYKFNIVIKGISDSTENYTRFVVIEKNPLKILNNDIKCSLCLFMNEDYPGILFDALKLFNEYKVNLNSIISRPTKEALGKYNFYIEISSKKDEINNILNCINDIKNDKRYGIKNLGIYSK